MGVTVGDSNNDGRLDIFVTNWIEQNNTLYENQGSHQFMDRTAVLGLSPLGFEYCGWGTGIFDFDNDGSLDLWISYGHTNEHLEISNTSGPFFEPNFLRLNLRGHKFGH